MTAIYKTTPEFTGLSHPRCHVPLYGNYFFVNNTPADFDFGGAVEVTDPDELAWLNERCGDDITVDPIPVHESHPSVRPAPVAITGPDATYLTNPSEE
jgi:hypothetical protein